MIIAKWTDANGNECQAEVLNPGNWFGKTYLIANACCYSPPMWIVEGGNGQDAIDEFIDIKPDEFAIPEEDMKDYKDDQIHYGGNGGLPCDLDNMYLNEIKCRYFGDNLPWFGIEPKRYNDWINGHEGGIEDARYVGPGKNSYWHFDPKNADDRLAYAQSYYTHSTSKKGLRACRLFLHLAGVPV